MARETWPVFKCEITPLPSRGDMVAQVIDALRRIADNIEATGALPATGCPIMRQWLNGHYQIVMRREQ